jgi:hypothetical protein
LQGPWIKPFFASVSTERSFVKAGLRPPRVVASTSEALKLRPSVEVFAIASVSK